MTEGPVTPTLSVIVPTYRGEELLGPLLQSFAALSVDPDLAEVIVVDDGTPGFDASRWEGMTGSIPLTVRARAANGGRAIVRNDGIRAARGEVVIFLDGDMTVEAGFLEAHADFHRQHANAAAVGRIRWAPSVPSSPFMRYAGQRGVSRYPAGPVPYKCFVTGNSSVRRRTLLDLGGFDEGFSTYGGEDLELGYRLHRAGVEVHHLPTAQSLHYGWRGLRGHWQSMEVYGSASLPLLLQRHPELDGVLRLDFLQAPWWSLRRRLLTTLLSPLVQQPMRGLTRVGEALGVVPTLLFDYCTWAARTRAFLQRRDGEAG